MSDKAYGREKKEEDGANESAKLRAEVRYKEAKAELEELRVKELKGELHRAEDVEAITTDHVLYLRSILMALPGKLAVDVAALDSASQVADRIKSEIYTVLKSLTDYEYDAEAYKKRVREREGWSEEQDEEE